MEKGHSHQQEVHTSLIDVQDCGLVYVIINI